MDNYRDLEAYNDSLYPILVDGDIDLRRYHKVPLDKIASLGVGMTAVTTAITTAASEGAGTGLYWVTVPDGRTLMQFKDHSAYLGSVKAVIDRYVRRKIWTKE